MASFKAALFALAGTALAAPVQLAPRGFSGQMTHYTPSQISNPPMGSCGGLLDDSQPIVAINLAQADKSKCGSWVKITYGGKTARAQFLDSCADCPEGNIDVTPVVFDSIVPLLASGGNAGRVGPGSDTNQPLTWEWEEGSSDSTTNNTPAPPATTTTAAPPVTSTTAAAVPNPVPETAEVKPETVNNAVVDEKKPEVKQPEVVKPAENSTPTSNDDGHWHADKTGPYNNGFYTPETYSDGTY